MFKKYFVDFNNLAFLTINARDQINIVGSSTVYPFQL